MTDSKQSTFERIPGVAPVKAEFVVYRPAPVQEPAAAPAPEEPSSAPAKRDASAVEGNDEAAPVERAEKQPRLSKKEQKKKFRGQNKAKERPREHIRETVQICSFVAVGEECTRPNCRFEHDAAVFNASREPDLEGVCPSFETFGRCTLGLRCRFAGSHTAEDGVTQLTDAEKMAAAPQTNINFLNRDLHLKLRKKQHSFPKTQAFVAALSKEYKAYDAASKVRKQIQALEKPAAPAAAAEPESATAETAAEDAAPAPTPAAPAMAPEEKQSLLDRLSAELDQAESAIAAVKIHPREKKTLDFRGKTYLAPLTTVGNLPFRRICKGYGVDITIGEMAHSHSITEGSFSEWALLKRHPSEDFFGVQVAGGKVAQVLEACELINEYCTVDFVDLNLGCPIDSVYGNGCGSALMDRPSRVRDILRGMDQVLDCPVTAKIRTGVERTKRLAHKYVPQFRDWGIQLTTLHGRSRAQRYKSLADWDYIRECAQLKGNMPLFGNGDMMCPDEYYEKIDKYGVDGIMVARGALVKPWLFTEIKERRVWDISARERFDMMRDFTRFGLEHWGSDTQGVNTTRRFLLEMLSFTHRYIPVGLLEVLPQRLNDRPPQFVGRDDMETMLASPYVGDMIKLSEMLLGPVPEGFHFLPKHKANAYEDPNRAAAALDVPSADPTAPTVVTL
ncbi:tRNA-dihydrouridine synthase 3 [Blastocladiella emersonii ATCC 22665]|nr:tRNA-dihydrouridine synthase 3 [Blastocladiella emersonii ATCC 22665]